MGVKPTILTAMKQVKSYKKQRIMPASRMSIRMPADMLEKIEVKIKESGLTFSGVVKEAVSEYLDKREK